MKRERKISHSTETCRNLIWLASAVKKEEYIAYICFGHVNKSVIQDAHRDAYLTLVRFSKFSMCTSGFSRWDLKLCADFKTRR